MGGRPMGLGLDGLIKPNEIDARGLSSDLMDATVERVHWSTGMGTGHCIGNATNAWGMARLDVA